MVRRENFINKIRELKYTFKTRQKRTQLWRKVGGTHRLSVPLCDLLEDDYVSSTLLQCGCRPDDIKAFLAANKN
jgi:hypothetical protein